MGKTFVIAAGLNAMAVKKNADTKKWETNPEWKNVKGVVYVTLSQRHIEQVKKNVELYKLADLLPKDLDIEYKIYDDLITTGGDTNFEGFNAKGKVLVFDEAHKVRNLDSSAKWGNAARNLLRGPYERGSPIVDESGD